MSPAPVLEDLSLVIPTLGRESLEATLAAVEAGNRWPARVIVVDQGRRPEIARMLEASAARGLVTEYVPSHETGRAAGVNRGIERVRTRFLAITDDDCLADPAWLERMAVVLRADPGCAVTGRVDSAGDEVVPLVALAEEARVSDRPSLRFDPLSGGNMGTSRDVLARVGLLDEDPAMRCAEDGEWAYRALRAGVRLRFEPDVIVSHVGWRDLGERTTQYRSYARSQGGFYGKYVARGDAFIALRLVVHEARALRRWLRGALGGDAEAARIGRAYATGLLPGFWAGLRSQAPSPPRLPDAPA